MKPNVKYYSTAPLYCLDALASVPRQQQPIEIPILTDLERALVNLMSSHNNLATRCNAALRYARAKLIECGESGVSNACILLTQIAEDL